jgi:hypothetical protein
VRESRWQAAVFLSFPVIYIAYMTTQRVLIVRNVLVVAPYLAVAAARGVRIAPRLAPARFRAAAVVGVVVLSAVGLGTNAVWLYRAAESVVRSTPNSAVADFRRYFASRPAGTVFASTGVRSALQAQNFDVSRLAVRAAQARELAFYPYEPSEPRSSNLWRLSSTWFGPYELNWNRYTDWGGFQRIVLTNAGRARSLGVRLPPLPGIPAEPPPHIEAPPKDNSHAKDQGKQGQDGGQAKDQPH